MRALGAQTEPPKASPLTSRWGRWRNAQAKGLANVPARRGRNRHPHGMAAGTTSLERGPPAARWNGPTEGASGALSCSGTANLSGKADSGARIDDTSGCIEADGS